MREVLGWTLIAVLSINLASNICLVLYRFANPVFMRVKLRFRKNQTVKIEPIDKYSNLDKTHLVYFEESKLIEDLDD
jgi:hypothetical protein